MFSYNLDTNGLKLKSRRDATECCSVELFCNLQKQIFQPHKPTSEETLPTVYLVTLAAQVHSVFKLGPSEHVFTRGDGILEQASTHHTDYTKLNTALCQHRQEADQSADVRTERRSLPATGYMSAGQCTYLDTGL